MDQHTIDRLKDLEACSEALVWAGKQNTWDDLWANCHRADWMLWIVGRAAACDAHSPERKRIVLCASDCARTALPCVQDENGRAQLTSILDRLQAYAENPDAGAAALAPIRSAASAAYAAAAATYAASAAYAAAAAASAAAAAYAASAAYASSAAAAYGGAAYGGATYAYARSESLRSMTAIVRKHYPTPPIL